jgi:hypothetical protein
MDGQNTAQKPRLARLYAPSCAVLLCSDLLWYGAPGLNGIHRVCSMLRVAANYLPTIRGGRGTADCVARARAAGIEVVDVARVASE